MVTLSASNTSQHEHVVDLVFDLLGQDPDLFSEPTGDNAASTGGGAPSRHEGVWVLCIDDDAEYSQVVKMRLESQGIHVVRAFAGMQGYRMAFTEPVSAILLDMEMPDGQGDYILGRLKDNPVTHDVPVIIVSGQKDRFLEQRMLHLGAARYLHKPPDWHELIAELQRHLGTKRTGLTKPLTAKFV